MTTACCAECGEEEGGASLKMCKPCMSVRYCNAECQRNHWPMHKKECKQHAAELRGEALFKDPPAKEECPICFLPMPQILLSCMTLPPATISSVPIYDFAMANEALKFKDMEVYYPCCGKSICRGCMYSSCKSGNNKKCPFCNSNRGDKTDEENVEEIMKRVEANDAVAMGMLAHSYHRGLRGVKQNQTKAMELYIRAAKIGCSKAHNNLANVHHEGGNMKKAKFHFEAAAMAGQEGARYNIGILEAKSGNMERAIKHWTIAASAGDYFAMHKLRTFFEKGDVSRNQLT